jgi:hypothetical protein
VVYSNACRRKICDWACDDWNFKSFYGEIRISDGCTFSEGRLADLTTV